MTFIRTGIITSILFISFILITKSFASNNLVVAEFDESKLSFDLYIDGVPNSYSVMSVFGLADQQLSFKVSNQQDKNRVVLSQQGIELATDSEGMWQYTMQKKSGVYSLTARHLDTNEVMQLNLFVLHDFSELDNNKLLDYQIGEYPQIPLHGLDAYLPPRGFIQVTPELLDLQVSPHFLLRQFLCKQKSDFPKFLVLNQKILFKLEQALATVNNHGIDADTFSLMSAYRTPAYNASIGQGIYSRHQWGDAVDIFIDVFPKDGIMDDINKDGLIDHADAAYLYELIDTMSFYSSAKILRGGIGDYSANKAHGPFVHIDTRGYRARWGNSAQ